MSQEKEVKDFPQLQEILNKCSKDIEKLIGISVTVHYKIKVHTISMNDLMAIICEICEVTPQELLGRDRDFNIIVARHLFFWFAKNKLGKTLKVIGEFIEKDHTTVIYACAKVTDLLQIKDEIYTDKFNKILEEIDLRISKPN